MTNCKFCGKPLKDSQYNSDRSMKSCPRCSQIDGNEHIFFPYPTYFGKTEHRSSSNNPDGPQSHCYIHRSKPNRPIPANGVKCSKIK